MPQLSVIDLAMFLLESPERPFNIGPLVLLRPPEGARRFAERLVARMLKIEPGPPFNYRLALSLTRLPSVEPMPDARASDQVHRIRLGGKASVDDLIAKVCELHETPLPRTGLLWQFYVIDGLADGRVALYGKVHHGIIDGRSFVRVVSQWFSTDPADKQVRAMWQGASVPVSKRPALKSTGPGTQQNDAGLLSSQWHKIAGVAGGLLGLYRMLAAQASRHLGRGGQALDLPFVHVPDVLSGVASAKRCYAFTSLPLDDLKAMGQGMEATVNDVLLAVLDGALARHLAEQSSQPGRPLVVDMPVALTGAAGGNQIAVLQLSLGEPGASPLQRLAAIVEETARVKAVVRDNGSQAVMLYTTLVHALPTLLERVGIERPLRISNVLFSNPFGLPARCWLMGAEVELALPMSVVTAGQMLNVTAVTLDNRVQIGLLGIPDAVDRIDRLAVHIEAAHQALKAAVADKGRRRPRASKKAAAHAQAASASALDEKRIARHGRAH